MTGQRDASDGGATSAVVSAPLPSAAVGGVSGDMKYPPVRLPMPDGVCEWLERELESRGIDAVVYTRYVLSLLRRDQHQALAAATAPRDDPEQLRRTAAVDCLASACDQVSLSHDW